MSGILEELLAEIRALRAELAERAATPAEQLVDVVRAAEHLGMSTSYIRKEIGSGRLPAKRIGRAVRVRVADLDTLTSTRRSSARPNETDAEWAAKIRISKIRTGGRS